MGASERSPFPGLDPYLQQFWGDLHNPICVYTADALQPQLSPNVHARIGRRANHPPGVHDGLRDLSESPSESFVRIVHNSGGGRVVTIIHFLTPAIKRIGALREAHLEWRDGWCGVGANFVEVDLLRGGCWTSFAEAEAVPPDHREADFHITVRRAARNGTLEFYPMRLNQRLPIIGIPLRSSDADAALDLKAIFDKEYVNGAFDLRIDYVMRCEPPLTGDAAVWADELLRKAGRRATAT